MTDLITLVQVKAVQSDAGERWIEGFATTNQEDRQNDVVEPRGAKFSLPIVLLFQHLHHEPIGAITQATVSEKGIRIRARLSVGVARAEEVWTLIKDGALTAVSIGFRVLEQKPHGSRGSRITSWEWLECSVVSVPANPGALISVSKCMAMDVKKLMPVGTTPATMNFPVKAEWMKGIATRGGIDANRIWDAAAQSSKQWVKEKHKEAPGKLPQLAGLFAKLAHGLSVQTLGRVIDLEQRLAALESNHIRGLRDAGFYKEGKTYEAGDGATFGGSFWIAQKDTQSKPGIGNEDWRLCVRKGRNGKDAR